MSALAAGVALGLGGCSMETSEAPSCDASMPAASRFLQDPAFAALTHRKRVDYDVVRGTGYDLWGDSNFEYRVALQVSLEPVGGGASTSLLCAREVSLRFALPSEGAKQQEQLKAFVRTATAGTALDAEKLVAQLEDARSKGAKYQLVADAGRTAVRAGTIVHPSRGEFFVVSFGWPR